ncbi:hypothetical protein [Breoghania sp.]|uniref:hypothetical protein n=1 Tax=Breoghania sp. TaxID=2065378 RepID=UPI0029C986C8|nr:hypothetical protein [Breoghania sp.]
MLPKFSNEVLSRGPRAILPQNLSEYWLKILQKHCDDFLDRNFAVDQCTETLDTGDPLLVACIHEVLQNDRPAGTGALAENITIYALSITMETIRRASDIKMPMPTLDDLLSIDRIVAFGKINPEFGDFLQRACILPEDESAGETNWFQRLKKKILERFNAA